MGAKQLYFLLTFLGLAILSYFLMASEVPADAGDGLSHYFIVERVWQEPIYLLDHWGKPLFTLFAAPFSLFGFYGYVCFNLLVYLGTCLLAFRIFSHFRPNSSSYWILLFPFGLLTSPDYATNIVGGMTEVFFGFLILLSAWLFLQKKWLWFAVIISFTPFARSEGQLLIILAVPLLIYVNAFRYLPILGFGFLIYACAGWFALDDFWWYFNNNPYHDASVIYGSGSWWHYLDLWPMHLGLLGLSVTFITFLLIILRKVELKFSAVQKLCIGFLVVSYFGILLTHMYLWTNGKNGALGLTRLAIHGWPGFLLCLLLVLESARIGKIWKKVFPIAFIFGSILFVYDYPFVYDQVLPKMATPDERAVLEASNYLNNRKTEFEKIYFTHPLFAWKMGVNIKDKSSWIQQFNGQTQLNKVFSKQKKVLFVIDSHFGEESRFPVNQLDSFEVIQTFTPLNQMVHRGETIAQVMLLSPKKSMSKQLTWKQIKTHEITVWQDSLYTGFMEMPKRNDRNSLFQLKISRIQGEQNAPMYFVIQGVDSGDALRFDLDEKQTWIFSLRNMGAEHIKFFVHNPNQLKSRFQIELYEQKKASSQ